MGFGRREAQVLLEEWTKGESLRKHGLAVSVCTESYGRREAERLGLSGAEADALLNNMPVPVCCMIWTTSDILRSRSTPSLA